MDTSYVKEEIEIGSLVEIDLDQKPTDQHSLKALEGWKRAQQWPLRVQARGHEHVILEDGGGRIVHFGSTPDPSFHIAHVKLAI